MFTVRACAWSSCDRHTSVTSGQYELRSVKLMPMREELGSRLCESRGGRPGLPVPNSPYVLCGRKATLNCVKVEVAVLGSRSLIVLMVSVDVSCTAIKP